ncbi:MAG: helix-turn-helix domain-containing protein [Cytophagales bacterium]|nr:helix-turn-helix domain-containing protein [Cytophagales bacterium]
MLSDQTIKEKLVSLRTARKWSQGDLAKVSGINRVMINRWEQGHLVPSEASLKKLAGSFGHEGMTLLNNYSGQPDKEYQQELLSIFPSLTKSQQFLIVSMAKEFVSSNKKGDI